MSRFIPDSDSDFAGMARDFADTVAKDPKRYALSDLDAELVVRKVTAFRDALAVSSRRATRTAFAIGTKDSRRREAEEIVRRLGAVIRANTQISMADKLLVRVKERSKKKTRRKCPVYPPELRYGGAIGEVGADSVMHVLHVSPGNDAKGKRSKEGATRIEVFADLVAPGEPIPRYPGEFSWSRPFYLRAFTKSPIRVKPPVPPTPMLVVYWVRYTDSNCDPGPWSKTCQSRWEGARAATPPTLGAMPEVRQLEQDAKQITVITQFRERYLEGVRVERMLEDSREPGNGAKQLPMPRTDDAAEERAA